MDWDLSVLFKNDDECEAFAGEVVREAAAFEAQFKGRLGELSQGEFIAAIARYEEIAERCARVESYVGLAFSVDTTRGAFAAKFEEICNEISQKLLFFELEFCALGDEKRAELTPTGAKFGYFLQNLAKEKPYLLAADVESALLKVSNVGQSAWSRFFDETLAAARFEFDGEALGEEEILAKLHDSRRDVRRRAADALTRGLRERSHTLTFVMNMTRRDLKNRCELRGYDAPESFRHIHNQISQASVDALVAAVEASFDIPREYYAAKRDFMGVGELFDYDRYAPFGVDEREFGFDEAREIVLRAFGEFSGEFATLAARAFAEGWIDALPKPHKQGGAFSHSAVSAAHPFVLLNFTRRRRDVFTLAHELGHAIHQHLAYRVGYLESHTPLVTAETASVFCEMLVFDFLRRGEGAVGVNSNLAGADVMAGAAGANLVQNGDKNAANPAKNRTENGAKNGEIQAKNPAKTTAQNAKTTAHIALLGGKIEDIFATLYRQINFTTFEREIHARDGELSADELGEIWLRHSAKMFGESLTLTEGYRAWWSYVPHFIHTPFYCYAYSYAQLLVLALFGLYKGGGCDGFVARYSAFLASGGSKSPAELVRAFGFDLDDRAFWDVGLGYVRGMVAEFRAMV